MGLAIEIKLNSKSLKIYIKWNASKCFICLKKMYIFCGTDDELSRGWNLLFHIDEDKKGRLRLSKNEDSKRRILRLQYEA